VSAWLKIACERTVYLRASKIALIVGTLLAVINHGDTILKGDITYATAIKVLLTYLVPYGVSTFSSVGAIRQIKRLK
jgi:cystathionine beta-lyase/cystathionine gamma-synthase